MKKIVNFLLLFIVTAVVLYFSLKDDYQTVVNTIFSINKLWLLCGFIFLFMYWVLKSVVTTKLVRNFNNEYSLKKGLKMTLETNFFHAITPFSSGGQPYEIYSLKKNGLRIIDATNVSIESFIVYQIALVLLGIIAIVSNYFFNFFPSSRLLKNLVTLGFIVNLLVIVGLFILTFTTKLSKAILNIGLSLLSKLKIIKNMEAKKNNLDKYLYDFHIGAMNLLKNKKSFILLIVIQFISLVFLYLVPYAIIKGVNLDIKIYIAVITSAYVMIIGSFVPIPGGTGGLEYGFVSFFGNFIINSKINAIMIMWRFTTYYFGMILGAIILGIGKREK